MANLATDAPAFMLYPRGFFGAALSPHIEKQPKPFSGDVNRLSNNLNYFKRGEGGSTLMVNENVEELYAAMITRVTTFQDFEFRERVLRVALAAFGTHAFDYWYTQQRYSPSCGELHRDFLVDTLRFIQGERRTQVPATWNVLIDYTDKGEKVSVLDEASADFFGISSNGQSRQPRNTNLIDVIQMWVGQPGGFEDLLFTMHILFGVQ